MNTILAILRDFTKYFNYKTKWGRVRLVLFIVLLVIAAQAFARLGQNPIEEPVESIPQVEVGTVSSVNTNSSFALIGSVESLNQARIQTETAGRVTSVRTTLGANVSAGSVIAELENASQYAALLQAEGSYEAAQASAAVSDVNVEDARNAVLNAQNGALNTYRSSFTTVNDVVLNTIDQFFSNPQESNFGVRIESKGLATSLVEQRKNMSNMLNNWQSASVSATPNSNLENALVDSTQNTNQVIVMLDTLINLTKTADQTANLDGVSLNSYTAGLISARASLNAVLNSINSSETALTSAKENLRKAEIGGTNSSQISAANAQIKQALGSLRAAQANFAKTIIRTPISGTVNELNIKTGDYLGQAAPVALVANNNALEITTYIGDNDQSRIELGQKVLINNSIEGVITAIAPAVDTATRKTEVKIGTESEDIETGATVTITLPEGEKSLNLDNQPILVPIEAVKFTANDGSMFKVEDSKLISFSVTLGPIVGSYVTIMEGLDRTTEFVLDARGLVEGVKVETITKS